MRSTQKLSTCPTFVVKKVVHNTRVEKERKREKRERIQVILVLCESYTRHLDESVHSSPIPRLISCESHTYTPFSHLRPIFRTRRDVIQKTNTVTKYYRGRAYEIYKLLFDNQLKQKSLSFPSSILRILLRYIYARMSGISFLFSNTNFKLSIKIYINITVLYLYKC